MSGWSKILCCQVFKAPGRDKESDKEWLKKALMKTKKAREMTLQGLTEPGPHPGARPETGVHWWAPGSLLLFTVRNRAKRIWQQKWRPRRPDPWMLNLALGNLCFSRGFHHYAGGLQHPSGEQQWHMEGLDQQKQTHSSGVNFALMSSIMEDASENA